MSDAKKLKAQIARQYPIENQLAVFMEKVVWLSPTPAELHQRLRVARYLATKAQSILTLEIDVRGAQDVLKAMEKVEQTSKVIDDLLKELGN
jgi:hypothetical protein